ncbi:MAG: SDR family NAD(P)-dependent oxidoreductase [Bryobacterales bacterium]|nr:SDR family NAD(P)-dependent oxidoreductase [Bryobacterales bacterium]
MRLRGKGAIVTGAGSGIGEAVARCYAEEGAEVVTVGRSLAKLEQARAAAGAAGARLRPYALDVGDAAAVDAMVAWALGLLPQVDILVNNAGTNVQQRALDKLSRKDFDTVVRVNLHGPFYLMSAVLPGMRERGDGVLITVSSIAGARTSVVAGASYSASKHGARSLGLAAHLEDGPRGIRSCVICPGEVNTPILEQRPAVPSDEQRAAMLQPEDVAQAALLVATLHPRACIPELVITPTDQAFA